MQQIPPYQLHVQSCIRLLPSFYSSLSASCAVLHTLAAKFLFLPISFMCGVCCIRLLPSFYSSISFMRRVCCIRLLPSFYSSLSASCAVLHTLAAKFLFFHISFMC